MCGRHEPGYSYDISLLLTQYATATHCFCYPADWGDPIDPLRDPSFFFMLVESTVVDPGYTP